MLKIPKQIYFDEPMLELYSAYAQYTKQPFAAVVRASLQKDTSNIKKALATSSDKPSLLKFYGAGKLPNQKHYTIKEERTAFMNALARMDREKKYA